MLGCWPFLSLESWGVGSYSRINPPTQVPEIESSSLARCKSPSWRPYPGWDPKIWFVQIVHTHPVDIFDCGYTGPMKKLNRTTILGSGSGLHRVSINPRAEEQLALLRDRLGISNQRNLVNYCIARVAAVEGASASTETFQPWGRSAGAANVSAS